MARDTNERGWARGRVRPGTALHGLGGEDRARRTRDGPDEASRKPRKLRQLCFRFEKFPLFAGISLDVKFLRFPEIVVA
jgi:hypothetical protein